MTSTATTTKATYRKTKTGEWVVFAPASALKPGTQIAVVKRDGTTKVETIATVGKTFIVEGKEFAYGYLAAKPAKPAKPAGRSNCCQECGEFIRPGSTCWETGLRH